MHLTYLNGEAVNSMVFLEQTDPYLNGKQHPVKEGMATLAQQPTMQQFQANTGNGPAAYRTATIGGLPDSAAVMYSAASSASSRKLKPSLPGQPSGQTIAAFVPTQQLSQQLVSVIANNNNIVESISNGATVTMETKHSISETNGNTSPRPATTSQKHPPKITLLNRSIAVGAVVSEQSPSLPSQETPPSEEQKEPTMQCEEQTSYEDGLVTGALLPTTTTTDCTMDAPPSMEYGATDAAALNGHMSQQTFEQFNSAQFMSPVKQNSGSSTSTSSSSSLHRDNSLDYKDASGIDLHEFMVKTLKENPRDRLMLLKLEKDFTEFINDANRVYQRYPPMTSYHRMLVHRVAAYFGLDHNVDSSGKSVIVNKTPSTRIPDTRFQAYCSREYTDEELSSDVPKSILLRSSTASSEEANSSPRPGSPMHDRYSLEDKRSKSFEEREDDYNKAKERIFKDNAAQEVLEMSSATSTSPLSTTSDGSRHRMPHHNPSTESQSEKEAAIAAVAAATGLKGSPTILGSVKRTTDKSDKKATPSSQYQYPYGGYTWPGGVDPYAAAAAVAAANQQAAVLSGADPYAAYANGGAPSTAQLQPGGTYQTVEGLPGQHGGAIVINPNTGQPMIGADGNPILLQQTGYHQSQVGGQPGQVQAAAGHLAAYQMSAAMYAQQQQQQSAAQNPYGPVYYMNAAAAAGGGGQSQHYYVMQPPPSAYGAAAAAQHTAYAQPAQHVMSDATIPHAAAHISSQQQQQARGATQVASYPVDMNSQMSNMNLQNRLDEETANGEKVSGSTPPSPLIPSATVVQSGTLQHGQPTAVQQQQQQQQPTQESQQSAEQMQQAAPIMYGTQQGRQCILLPQGRVISAQAAAYAAQAQAQGMSVQFMQHGAQPYGIPQGYQAQYMQHAAATDSSGAAANGVAGFAVSPAAAAGQQPQAFSPPQHQQSGQSVQAITSPSISQYIASRTPSAPQTPQKQEQIPSFPVVGAAQSQLQVQPQPQPSGAASGSPHQPSHRFVHGILPIHSSMTHTQHPQATAMYMQPGAGGAAVAMHPQAAAAATPYASHMQQGVRYSPSPYRMEKAATKSSSSDQVFQYQGLLAHDMPGTGAGVPRQQPRGGMVSVPRQHRPLLTMVPVNQAAGYSYMGPRYIAGHMYGGHHAQQQSTYQPRGHTTPGTVSPHRKLRPRHPSQQIRISRRNSGGTDGEQKTVSHILEVYDFPETVTSNEDAVFDDIKATGARILKINSSSPQSSQQGGGGGSPNSAVGPTILAIFKSASDAQKALETVSSSHYKLRVSQKSQTHFSGASGDPQQPPVVGQQPPPAASPGKPTSA